jgi:hypothetical protein
VSVCNHSHRPPWKKKHFNISFVSLMASNILED